MADLFLAQIQRLCSDSDDFQWNGKFKLIFSELVFIFFSECCFLKVVARFNEVVTKLLLEGAIETFKKYSVREEDIEVNLFACGVFKN